MIKILDRMADLCFNRLGTDLVASRFVEIILYVTGLTSIFS
jgi:hypothetical protein